MVFGLFSKKKKILKAIENGEVDLVSSLLENFDKINLTFSKPDNKDVAKWTYLLHSCKVGNAEIVKSLLEKGADLSSEDSDGKRPLYWASCNDDDDEAARICNLLLERGVDINHQATDGRTALFAALINTNNKTLEMLLRAGADTNFRMEDGQSILHIAAIEDVEVVKLLLEHNANPNIENHSQITPICSAANSDNMEIIHALVKGGADINHEAQYPDGRKMYPLDAAIGYDSQTVAMYLFTKGAKHNPDLSDLEVMAHANEEQESFHGELGAEGKYHYELHIKDLNREQIKHMKSQFEEYTWDMGFAVTYFEYKQDGDLFKIVFDECKTLKIFACGAQFSIEYNLL